jgi:hypothetical protein
MILFINYYYYEKKIKSIFNLLIIIIGVIIILFMFKPLVIPNDNSRYDELRSLIEKGKITRNYNYRVIYPDSTNFKRNNDTLYSCWFVYYESGDNSYYKRKSYGVKIRGGIFDEKQILKKIDKKRNYHTKEGFCEDGGITFFKQITYQEFRKCECRRGD